MGCASTCTGYELTANIDLDTDGGGSANSADAYWNSGSGWQPIGNDSNKYTGDFKGNGFTIDNLFINRQNTNYIGLFGEIESGSRVETLGVTNATITGRQNSAILVGYNRGAAVVACYTTGSVTARGLGSGGLVGYLNRGSITTSYSTASVSGTTEVGGLVGFQREGSITNSYATGRVSGSAEVGGLLGGSIGANAIASYWDTQTSNLGNSDAGTGQLTNALQSPTGYTGIYANWNVDMDGDRVPDNPWNFGTTSQYPTLRTPASG